MHLHVVRCLWYISFFMITGLPAQYGPFEAHVFSNGPKDTLPYRLLKPLHEDNTKSYPLVVFLHGAGELGNDNTSQLVNFPQCFLDSNNRESYPCYVIAPQCPADDSWDAFPNYPNGIETSADPTKAMSLLLSLVDSLRLHSALAIDKNRVYVTGLSLGGEGTFDILTRAPAWFAAAIPICGIADTNKALLIKNIPLWIFAGSLDDVNPVKYDRMIVEVLQRSGGKPKYTEYKDLGHNCWTTAYAEPDLLHWLFAQNKKNGTSPAKNIFEKPVVNFSCSPIKNHSLMKSWKCSLKPEVLELFLLNGKCVFRHPVIGSNSLATSISLPQSAHGRYVLRIVSNKLPVLTKAFSLP